MSRFRGVNLGDDRGDAANKGNGTPAAEPEGGGRGGGACQIEVGRLRGGEDLWWILG